MAVFVRAVTVILILNCFTVRAQGIRILDAHTKEELANVVVALYKGEFIAQYTTDSTGLFFPHIQPSDSVKAVVGRLGYTTQHFTDRFPDTIYLAPDVQLMQEVVVEAFGSRTSMLYATGAVASVTKKDLDRFPSFNFLSSANYQPGVQVEQRAPGSYRIAIRGTTLRSPFGVRNVKTYLNGLPFTEANGNTPLNLIDPGLIESMTILKGPSASYYGAGPGGVILLDGQRPRDAPLISAEVTGGEGLAKVLLTGHVGNIKREHSGAVAWQKESTNRAHTNFERKSAYYQGTLHTGDGESLSVDLLYSKIYYEIPGGLTAEQLAEDRNQARPGSESQNASINQEIAWGGFRYEKSWGNGWFSDAGIYSYGSFFDHPFNFDYKREVQVAGGGRATVEKQADRYRIILGGEYQKEVISAQNLGNVNGTADTLNFSDEIANKSWMTFAQVKYDIMPRLDVTAGLSLNKLRFGVNRLYDAATDSSYNVVRDYSPVWAPRLAFRYGVGLHTYLYSSLSYGYSPPTLDEFRTNEGTIDSDLEAEKAVNIELGIRSEINKKLFFELNSFYLRQRETIVTRTSPRGTQLFDNAGSTDQWGIEGGVRWAIVTGHKGPISQAMLQASFTRYWFLFDEYIKDENDYSGNELPGAAPYNFSLAADVNMRGGFYLHSGYNLTAPIPLNDANTVYSDRVHIVRTRLGYRKSLIDDLQMDVYMGGENLLDGEFSLGNDLNAFGGRYYQPAPGRRIYGGIKLTFN